MENKKFKVFRYETITSTNDIARQMLPSLTADAVIIAEAQTEGRGRCGREFHSPAGTGIYMSVVLRGVVSADAHLLTPAAAVAVCRAVTHLCGLQPQIKWVNDVLIDNKKVCGILSEAVGADAIIGIGINYSTDFSDMPELNAASLFAGGHKSPPLRDDIIVAVADELSALCADLPSCLAQYRALSCLIGRQISYTYNSQTHTGTVTGIDDAARLLVNGTALSSGEVTAGSSKLIPAHKAHK